LAAKRPLSAKNISQFDVSKFDQVRDHVRTLALRHGMQLSKHRMNIFKSRGILVRPTIDIRHLLLLATSAPARTGMMNASKKPSNILGEEIISKT
jgi:hypothetical protein